MVTSFKKYDESADKCPNQKLNILGLDQPTLKSPSQQIILRSRIHKAKKRLLTLHLQSKLFFNKSSCQPKIKEALPSHHFKQLLLQTHLEQCLQDDLSIGPSPLSSSFFISQMNGWYIKLNGRNWVSICSNILLLSEP